MLKTKTKLIWALVGGLCIAGGSGYLFSPAGHAPSRAPTEVQSATATTVHHVTTVVPRETLVELDGRAQLVGGSHVIAAETAGRVLATMANVGDLVEAGAVLARIDGRDAQDALAQALADVRKAESAAMLASRTYEDQVRLADKDYVSLHSVREAEAALLAAQAQVANVQALAAQRQRDVDGMIVRTQQQGVVTARKVTEGQYVTKGTPLFDIQPEGAMEVVVQVPPALADTLTTQTKIQLKDASGQVSVDVLRIAPHVSADLSRSVYVKAPAGVLAGQFIKAFIPTATTNLGHLVPASALVLDGQNAFVWKIVSGAVKKQAVTLRNSGVDGVWLEGLAVGDTLAVSSASLLREGQAVAVVEVLQ